MNTLYNKHISIVLPYQCYPLHCPFRKNLVVFVYGKTEIQVDGLREFEFDFFFLPVPSPDFSSGPIFVLVAFSVFLSNTHTRTSKAAHLHRIKKT